MEETFRDESVEETIAELLKNLKLGDETARRYAAEDLGYGQYEKGIEGLVEGLSDESIAVAEACADALVRIGGEGVVSSVVPALASEDVRLRNLSAEILSLLGEPAVPRLAESLKSDNRDVRKFAVDTLSQIGSDSSIDALVIALGDSDVNVAASAADGIGELGHIGHVKILEKYIASDVWMKCSVIRGIGLLGGEHAFSIIRDTLAQEENLMVKLSCVQALSNIGISEGLKDLILLLTKESIGLFGGEVLEAVGKILEKNLNTDISQYCTKEEFQPIVTLSKTDNLDLQIQAIQAIGCYQSQAFLKDLISLFDHPDPELRKKACHAVITLVPENLSLLESVLDDENKSVEAKAAAIQAIGQSSHEGRYSVVRKFLTMDDPILPRVTLDAIYKGLHPVPKEEMIRLLKSPTDEIRISAANAMGRVGAEDFIAHLIAQLDDSDGNVVQQVDAALITIGNSNTNSIIQPYMNSLNTSERKMAFEYFYAHNPEQEQTKFMEGLNDPDPEIRSISFKVIENLGVADLNLIKKGLEDHDRLVCVQAARALNSLEASKEIIDFIKKILSFQITERVKVELTKVLTSLSEYGSIDLLKNLLHDSSIWVQIEAVEALREIGDDSVVDDLKKLLDSENDDLVEAVHLALEELDF
ncbi:MAG: HEAT repeat protein [bacterium]|jgi:HEAT repeat protein